MVKLGRSPNLEETEKLAYFLMASAASYHRMIKILMKMVPGRPHAWVETVFLWVLNLVTKTHQQLSA